MQMYVLYPSEALVNIKQAKIECKWCLDLEGWITWNMLQSSGPRSQLGAQLQSPITLFVRGISSIAFIDSINSIHMHYAQPTGGSMKRAKSSGWVDPRCCTIVYQSSDNKVVRTVSVDELCYPLHRFMDCTPYTNPCHGRSIYALSNPIQYVH